MTVQTALRNATLSDLAELLKDQQARKIDMVIPSTKLRSEGGVLVVEGADAQLDADGVTQVDGRYLPTRICDEGIAEKLGVPLSYVRKLRETRPDLYDVNVNGWLHGSRTIVDRIGTEPVYETVADPDPRSFLLRAFRGDPGEVGIGRALLSDTYGRIDNLDVVVAALQGIRQADVDAQVVGCDLTERTMRVRVIAPSVQATAENLLAEYRSPFRDTALDEQRRKNGNGVQAALDAMATWGRHSGTVTDPVVFAGWELGNSETGGGAFSITPRIVFRVCNNGATMTHDAIRKVHVGGKLDAGEVKWTEDTQRKAIELVTAKTRDAVATFLSEDYLRKQVERIEEKAGIAVNRPAETIEKLGKALTYDEQTIAGVLDHFTRGGQMTAGGVLNAVTSYAQLVTDADKAAELEASALRALDFAAALVHA